MAAPNKPNPKNVIYQRIYDYTIGYIK